MKTNNEVKFEIKIDQKSAEKIESLRCGCIRRIAKIDPLKIDQSSSEFILASWMIKKYLKASDRTEISAYNLSLLLDNAPKKICFAILVHLNKNYFQNKSIKQKTNKTKS